MARSRTDAGAAQLRVSGYAVLRGLLDSRVAARVASAVPKLRDECRVDVCRRPNNTLVPLCWDSTPLSSVLANRTCMQRVHAASGGGDLRWVSAYLSIKEPTSGSLPCHQDWWCWDHSISFASQAPQVALLCYVDAANAAGGALRVLPGSHHSLSPLHRALAGAESATAPHDGTMHDQPGQVTIEVAAGDAVLVDYRTLHGTHANSTTSTRSCLIVNFAPNWCALPQEIRGHLIQAWGLPGPDQARHDADDASRWLPSFTGVRRDLPLSRQPPT